MYSIPPALISLLFLGYGMYVVCNRREGPTYVATSFFALCVTTFFWQGTWAVLFQTRDPGAAMVLIKLGYLLILFLPTSLYHFLVEISERKKERRYVYISYGMAAIFAAILLSSDLFVSGYYKYFWGYYPKAGPIHPLHVLQTAVVVMRGLYITYRQQQGASRAKRNKLRLCVAGLLVYFFAAIDYLCNYGIEFYPPGVLFIAVSLGILTVAIVKYDLLNPMAMAASIAHEIRTPLLSIRMQATMLAKWWPELIKGYQLAVQHGLCEPSISKREFDHLPNFVLGIKNEVDQSNAVIDMTLASATMDQMDTSKYRVHSIEACISDALKRYPFAANEREKIQVDGLREFQFWGSDSLLVYVVFNLLKNALYALKAADKGTITISSARDNELNVLRFTDTGTGIPINELPHIFDAFFTTKKNSGAGMGLTFCERVMTSFGGRIRCDSAAGEYTSFSLEFPIIANTTNEVIPSPRDKATNCPIPRR